MIVLRLLLRLLLGPFLNRALCSPEPLQGMLPAARAQRRLGGRRALNRPRLESNTEVAHQFPRSSYMKGPLLGLDGLPKAQVCACSKCHLVFHVIGVTNCKI